MLIDEVHIYIRYYNSELFKKQPKARAALHGAVMNKIRYFFDDAFAVICITQEQLKQFNAALGMTEGFVDFPLNVDTVEVAASLLEVKKGQYKISLRSKTYADANKIAGGIYSFSNSIKQKNFAINVTKLFTAL